MSRLLILTLLLGISTAGSLLGALGSSEFNWAGTKHV